MDNAILNCFANGKLINNNNIKSLQTVEWKEHSCFKDVFLKDILSKQETENLFSAHLIKIMPGAVIDTHTHEESIELHEIIAGSGECDVEGIKLVYNPGVVSVIPCGAEHKVVAGQYGLCLLAKFVSI